MTECTPAILQRAHQLFDESQRTADAFIDRLFAGLMLLQWVAALGAALAFSPTTWAGNHSWVHPHVWWAAALGGLLAVMPVTLALTKPGSLTTRLVIATAQPCFSALLIHLTGGRIETHFHVFGSLAFLAFYRDLRVLALATAIVTTDHFVRGVWHPASVFGVTTTSPYRWMEHAGWVVFEDVFLFLSIQRGLKESRLAAIRQAAVEASHERVELKVQSRTRELVAANAKATEAARVKGEFLTNMSHEIRTPIGAIIGYADLLLDPRQSPSDRIDSVQTIRRNGAHLLNVINDILDISKIEAGKLTVEHIPTDPAQIVEEVRSLMQVRADEKGISLSHRCEQPFPSRVHTDPVRLRQILINLVGNAIKFTGSGRVSICATFIPGPSPSLRFDVADTGIGMTSEQVSRIFQPFTQADASTSRRFGGTGLGLTIARNLAMALGGDIDVVSEPGKGSTFTATVQAGRADEISMDPKDRATTAPAAVGQPMVRLEGVRILLAEDGLDNQRLLRHYLTRAGSSVTVAENGRIAVDYVVRQALQQHPFDLVLMDMQMPELDGYGAASLLRAKGCTLPIIALTAHAMQGDREKCIAAGCDDYLTKPVDCGHLLSTCARWASKPGTVAPATAA